MDVRIILGFSLLTQLAAAGVALWLIRVTGRRWAWILIASAIGLMAARRGITEYRIVSGDAAHPPDIAAELLSLLISMLMLLGLVAIAPIIRALRPTKRGFEELGGRFRQLADDSRAGVPVEQVEGILDSEAIFHRLCNSAPIGVYLTDADGQTVYVNRRLLEISGLDEDGARGWGWLKAVHPDDRERVTREARESARDGTDFRGEFRILRKDGTVRWVFTQNAGIVGADGALRGKVGTVEDITERKQAEITLRESEQRLQGILENTTAVVYAKDRDGRYLLVNRRYEHLFHCTQAEIVGKTDDAVFPRHMADAFRENDRRVFDAGRAIEFEETVLQDDGVHTYVSLKFPLFDETGQAYAVCGISTDITDRKRAEEALRTSSAKLAVLAQEQRTLIEHTSDFLYRHDTKGVFNYVSPVIEQITGYSPGEWRNHYTTYMTDNPINQRVVEYTEETLRTGRESPPYLAELRHKDGHAITIEVNERPFFENGKIAGVVGVARDVTERERVAEELRKAKDAAEAASRAKSVFLANVSHEIRTPIMAMLGAAELSRPERIDQLGWDRRDIILRNGRHLVLLIDDILDLARSDATGLEVHTHECSLLEIIADVQAVAAPLERDPDVEFKLSYDSPIPAVMQTDPTRAKQAVINLLRNALKFTQRGHVHIHVRVDGHGPNATLRVSIEDTGGGLAEEEQDRIFEPFAKLEPAGGDVAQGVGLGLPLARAIARQLGGDVEVESTVGEGSTFTFRAQVELPGDVEWFRPEPLARQSAERPDDPSDTPRLAGSVLLAEDFRDTREMIEYALVRAGADVTAVANGKQAVEAAARREFDLILMDVRMPEMDGLTAAGEIRKLGSCTTMIALTASAAGTERGRIIDAGFDDLWLKPMSLYQIVCEASAYLDAAPRVRSAPPPERRPSRITDVHLAEIVAGFAASLPERVAGVRKFVENGDIRQARDLLHQLAGSGGIHGFMSVSDEAARLLKLADRGGLSSTAGYELEVLERLAAEIALGTERATDAHLTSDDRASGEC